MAKGSQGLLITGTYEVVYKTIAMLSTRPLLSPLTRTIFRPSYPAFRYAPQRSPPNFSPSYRYARMSTSIPEKMKCILVKNGKGTADDLYMGEEQVPTLEKGQVLVKVRSSLLRSPQTPLTFGRRSKPLASTGWISCNARESTRYPLRPPRRLWVSSSPEKLSR